MLRSCYLHIVLLALLMLFVSSGLKAQYYTPTQIQTIHNAKQAYEGDLYLDTINKDYYIGITTGELKVLADKQDIDSIRILMPQRELVVYISNGDADTVQMDPSNDVWIDVNDNILARNSESQTLNGANNIALGLESMSNNVGASSYKIALGYRSGRYEKTVGDAYVNTIGNLNGYNNIGQKSNGFGTQVMYNNTGELVYGMGYQSLYNNTGDSVNFIGYQAGFNNKGSNNLAIGSYSLREGKGNGSLINAIGYQAARYDSTNGNSYLNGLGVNVFYLNNGKYVNAFGTSASFRNKGDYNNFIGTSSGQENRGSYLNLIGYQSGLNNKGDHNTGFGMYSLRDMQQIANYNTGIGQYAMRLDSSLGDSYNSFMGYYAGYQNKSKYFTGIGYRAGYRNRASRVTTLGPNTVFSGKGSRIVALGNSAGYLNEGNYLIAFGHLAGRENKGDHNVAIGMYTYRQVLKANYVVAIGHYALSRDSSVGDVYNIAFGYYSGYTNKGTYLNAMGSRVAYYNTGNYVTGMGYQAARSNVGDRLVGFGYQAGLSNKGMNNISIGFLSMNDKPGDGSMLTSIGHYASRYDSVMGISQSNVIGYFAGYYNAGRRINVIGSNSAYFNRKEGLSGFGYQAGYKNKGKENIAIGSYTMSEHFGEGNYITAIGLYSSRYDSTQGDAYNNGIGVYSNYFNNGKYINSLGYQAGYRSNGNHHNALGPYALLDKANEGNYNNAIGYQSLRFDSSVIGYVNAIGTNVGYNNTGDYSILFGSNAGYNNKGSNSIGLGSNSLYRNKGNYNVAVGYQTGYYSNGDKNVYLGTNAGVYHEFGDNNIFIGNSSGRSSLFTRSNSFFVSNAYNTATLYADLDVKEVGVNTIAPDNNLSVNGTANKTGGGAWATFSDRRLKKRIKPYVTGFESLKSVNTVSYQYNDKYEQLIGENELTRNKNYQGVIAQEIVEVLPTMVSEVELEEETYLQVDPSNFTYMLINTLKKQEEEITLLEEQLELLKRLAKEKSQNKK